MAKPWEGPLDLQIFRPAHRPPGRVNGTVVARAPWPDSEGERRRFTAIRAKHGRGRRVHPGGRPPDALAVEAGSGGQTACRLGDQGRHRASGVGAVDRAAVGSFTVNDLAATARFSLGTDRVDELVKLAEEIQREYPNCVFFTSKLVFRSENWVTRLLHNQTALALQRKLHLSGMQMVILPMQL